MNLKTGMWVKDVITGFAGRVTGIVTYISGCDQALVQPEIKKDDGTFVEARWFDVIRLEVESSIPQIGLASASVDPGHERWHRVR